MMPAWRVLYIVVGGLLLASCGVFKNPGSPEPAFNIDQDLQELEKQFGSGNSVADYYSLPETAERRNRFVAGRLVLVNLQYIKFIRNFAADKAQIDSAMDVAVIGVDLAITLVGGAATKSILGAVSGGMTSSKVSIEKNFFQEKTVPALVGEMNAKRKQALIPILEGMQKPLNEYPFQQALTDLHAYYEAGTFFGALQSIQQQAGEKEQRADNDLKQLRVQAYGADEATVRIKSFVGFDSAANQFTKPENLAKLRAWKQQNGLEGISVTLFLNGRDFKEQRLKAIEKLNIP